MRHNSRIEGAAPILTIILWWIDYILKLFLVNCVTPKCIENLISQIEETIEELEPHDYFNESLRRNSNALLHLFYCNYERIKENEFSKIDERIEICRRTIVDKHGEINYYVIAQQLPLFIINLYFNSKVFTNEKYNYIPLLNHKKSDIRIVTYYCLWNIRAEINNEKIIECLLLNIAETLGYVEEAVGLLFGIINDEDDFFKIALNYTPPNNWTEQFKSRISQVKENNLLSHCYLEMLNEEVKTLKHIENMLE
ncbi:hypothetical protein CKO12_01515 [Chromatium okenii]|uniref:hypothetical protein n=1 Tax=Chromatium okenii TaxID=61644 RepID=UPI0019089DB8|nr:hypothetical protein [Chromatium okenii]MBK1640577.1 hypothetical protein [Chromatium okenii]